MNTYLLEKIKNKQAKTGVIGLGYVGLPLAVEFCNAGFSVVGVDVSDEKVKQLQAGDSYVLDVPSSEVAKYVNNGQLTVTSDFALLHDVDTISIAVPTPLRKTKDPDISYIVSAMSSCKPFLHNNLLIVLESTTYPGTTRELVAHEVEQLGFKVGENIFVAFSPERVDPGNPKFQTKNTPKVIGGITPLCTELAYALYGQVIDTVIPVGSTEEAEMVKLLENTFRAVNIGLVNELMVMCERMSIDIWNVIDAASTKPFGFMPFYPGPGLGGHCIPLDPIYLSWKAKTFNFYNRFIELASDINGNMPRFAVSKLAKVLNWQKKSVNGSKILILGMTYKSNVNDLRESPALEIYEMLKLDGAEVLYHDPLATSFLDDHGNTVYGVELSVELLNSVDCVLCTTAHDLFDYNFVVQHAPQILDTRNAFKNIKSSKIVRL